MTPPISFEANDPASSISVNPYRRKYGTRLSSNPRIRKSAETQTRFSADAEWRLC